MHDKNGAIVENEGTNPAILLPAQMSAQQSLAVELSPAQRLLHVAIMSAAAQATRKAGGDTTD
ncbi:MAG: hypothetical protein IJU26_06500 [Synergistaceae bacterium]|nr:hypothetical protein [Synergistaceae bacterium]